MLFNFNPKSQAGFTLIEVLLAAVILSVGLVVIFEVFLSSLDVVSLFDNRLNANWFLNEKIWQLQSDFDRQSGMFIPLNQSGVVKINKNDFQWQIDLEIVDAYQELYKATLEMSWKEGSKNRAVKRQVMVKSFFSNANPWKKVSQ
jgi:prepilin-type N-terminal cleavage/methylation domain-containing protein